jgi:hypothetical protein
LRDKEKYLNSEEFNSSPVKRGGKGKGVNVEKALVSWVRRMQKKGSAVTMEDLKETAQKFTSMPHGNADCEPITSAWLDQFMSKHVSGSRRLNRRASETNVRASNRAWSSTRASASPALAPSQPQSAISPASSSGHITPSPLSASRGDEEKGGINAFLDFGADGGAYKHSNSQSTTSLSSAFTDTPTMSFSGSAISPTASFSFSPDPNLGGFLAGDRNDIAAFQRPRSQTFPTLDIEYMNRPQPTEPEAPKYHVPSTAPSSALDSASSELAGSHFSFEQAVSSPPRLRRTGSNGSIAGRPSTATAPSSAVGSSPSSPTQDDARRAADTLLLFIRNAGPLADPNDYSTILRLTEKLGIHQSQLSKAAASHGMGGLSRIPEGDGETPNVPPSSMVKMEPGMP